MEIMDVKNLEAAPKKETGAEAFISELKSVPKENMDAARLLIIGFMNGLDAARTAEESADDDDDDDADDSD